MLARDSWQAAHAAGRGPARPPGLHGRTYADIGAWVLERIECLDDRTVVWFGIISQASIDRYSPRQSGGRSRTSQAIGYVLSTGGQTIARGSLQKGDCAAEYTWCHGVVDMNDSSAGVYTLTENPVRICHTPGHVGGNGFVRVTGIPR